MAIPWDGTICHGCSTRVPSQKFGVMKLSNEVSAALTSKTPTLEDRFYLEQLFDPQTSDTQLLTQGKDVIEGLTNFPKSLPPRYFYDDRGSQLFELICELPEYYPTRTEAAILNQCATEIAQLTGPCEMVELGSGSSTKTRILLDAYSQQYESCRYLPIDVSGGILKSSAKSLLREYPTLHIHGLIATYEQALLNLPPTSLPTRMICFLGSSIGNLNPQQCDQFLGETTQALQPGEYFLLGVDLHKSSEILEPAYNDSQGITAQFNLNMLRHLNRQFEGNFNLQQFEHWSFYHESQRQIEMHLRSKIAQTIELKALDLRIELGAGETILTEISRKFDLELLQNDLAMRGLMPLATWSDPQQWFGLVLCRLQA